MVQYIDPYEQCIQYPTVKDGIEAHAEVYSFNIESELFSQLTKEQQKLWRKEIEQACISGSDAGYLLARDTRYKENLEVEEVDLEKEIDNYIYSHLDRPRMELEFDWKYCDIKFKPEKLTNFARHFFELGMAASNNAQKGE